MVDIGWGVERKLGRAREEGDVYNVAHPSPASTDLNSCFTNLQVSVLLYTSEPEFDYFAVLKKPYHSWKLFSRQFGFGGRLIRVKDANYYAQETIKQMNHEN